MLLKMFPQKTELTKITAKCIEYTMNAKIKKPAFIVKT